MLNVCYLRMIKCCDDATISCVFVSCFLVVVVFGATPLPAPKPTGPSDKLVERENT